MKNSGQDVPDWIFKMPRREKRNKAWKKDSKQDE
jgi:hypothetical protein